MRYSIKKLSLVVWENVPNINNLEAFAVDDGWTALFVLLLCDPHGLEGGQRCDNGATDPDGVFALRGSNDLDLQGGCGGISDFLLDTVSNTGVHGGTTRQDDVGEEILSDVNIAGLDTVAEGLVDANGFHTDHGWVEENLRATEALVTNGDDLTVGEFIGLVKR